MKQSIRTLSLLMCLIMVFSLMPFSAAAAKQIGPFTDVSDTAWYADSVKYVYDNKLMNGTSDKTFEPQTTTTRAMVVTILHRQAGTPAPTVKNKFKDVASGKWYTEAIVWAAEKGVVSGYSAEKFGPSDAITREQMATILCRYAKMLGVDTSAKANLKDFKDAGTVSSWAKDAIQWAVASGLMQGMSKDTLGPKGNTTRAQVATLLMRFIENIVPKPTPAPTATPTATPTLTPTPTPEPVVFSDFYADHNSILVDTTETVLFYAQVMPEYISTDPVYLCREDGSHLAEMRDDGMEGDEIAGDGTYTASVAMSSGHQGTHDYYASNKFGKSLLYGVGFYLDLTDEELSAGDDVMTQLFAIARKYPITDNDDQNVELALKSHDEIHKYLEKQKNAGTVVDFFDEGDAIVFIMPGNLRYEFLFEALLYDASAKAESLSASETSASVLADSYQANQSEICTLEPFDFQHPTTCLSSAGALLTDVTLPYVYDTAWKNGDVTVERMKELGKYHIILMDTHGGRNSVCTGEEPTDESLEAYSADRQLGRISTVGVSGVDEKTYYAIDHPFFETYYHGETAFDQSLIYFGSCHGADDSALANVFLNRGASTVLAFKNSVFAEYAEAMCEEVVSNLCKTHSDNNFYTVEEAVKLAKDTLGKTDEDDYDWVSKLYGSIFKAKDPAELFIFGRKDFTILVDRDYHYFGDARLLSDSSVELTPLETWSSGSIWFLNPYPTDQKLTISFSYWAGGGRGDSYNGADGLMCAFADEFGLGGNGEYLGFVEGDSYGVEFDSYPHNSGDPDGKHIAVVHSSAHSHVKSYLTDAVDDSKWHDVQIVCQNGTITVSLDGAVVLTCEEVELSDQTYIGFSAATGAGKNRHLIRDMKVETGS